jgi:hypothetical protein
MKNELKNYGIKQLSTWDIGRTVEVRDGYDSKSIPEACPENMKLLMDKINELTEVVNYLNENTRKFFNN